MVAIASFRNDNHLRRRPARHAAAMALLLALTLTGCDKPRHWHSSDISGSLPTLAFSMTRASDGKVVTADDYRGKVTLLYFGYTFCPDICPLTLSNLTQVIRALGPTGTGVRVLFVTVDPKRDTLPVLKRYTEAFGPQVNGLRGDPDALAALARRYRVAYSATPASSRKPYEVTHSSGIYAFDREGHPRLIISSLSDAKPDLAGAEADLRALLD